MAEKRLIVTYYQDNDFHIIGKLYQILVENGCPIRSYTIEYETKAPEAIAKFVFDDEENIPSENELEQMLKEVGISNFKLK